MKTVTVHPADLNIGDTIMTEEGMKTVGVNTVNAGFFGTVVDGLRADSVERVLFPKWFKGQITGYHPQI